MLTKEGCKVRQERLLKKMEENSWDAFVTADRRTTYYLTGYLSAPDFPVILLLWADGQTALLSGATSGEYADEMVPLETYSIQRSIDLPDHHAALELESLLTRKQQKSSTKWALEKFSVTSLFEDSIRKVFPKAEFVDASETLMRMRKKKEEDEIAGVRENLKYCRVAYDAAREAIQPGLTEFDIYNAMHNAMVREAGTRIDFVGDFACGDRGIAGGGPPTTREIQNGDLYILDLLPAANLYFADTCRTFIVGEPTKLQYKAWETTLQAVRLAESLIKPGVLARDVYKKVKSFLDSVEFSEKSFWHHVGHGIGHRGHEAPRIIPGSDDVFEVGDVFTIEPGMYSKALQGGIRLEDDYVVRDGGIEDLFEYPWDL